MVNTITLRNVGNDIFVELNDKVVIKEYADIRESNFHHSYHLEDDVYTCSKWQPIETAPKNVGLLLGYKNQLGNWRTVRGEWFSKERIQEDWDFLGEDIELDKFEGWYETAENAEEIPNLWEITPTRWMPLPLPPAEDVK